MALDLLQVPLRVLHRQKSDAVFTFLVRDLVVFESLLNVMYPVMTTHPTAKLQDIVRLSLSDKRTTHACSTTV